MKKSILLVLLLLFSCMSDDDPVSPPEQPPKDTVDTVKTDTNVVDTNEVDTPITSPPKDTIPTTALITKEKADTIMFNFLIDELNCDTVDILSQFKLIRIDTVYEKGDTIAVLRNMENDSSITIVLQEDSWVYYSHRFGIDCYNLENLKLNREGFTIINAYTEEITPKIEGYGCSSWYISENFADISTSIMRPTSPVDILAEWRIDDFIEN